MIIITQIWQRKSEFFKEMDKGFSSFLAMYNNQSATTLGKMRGKFGPFLQKIGFFLKISIFTQR